MGRPEAPQDSQRPRPASAEPASERDRTAHDPWTSNGVLLALAVLGLLLRLLFWSGTEVQETVRADAYHYTYLAWSLANRGIYEDTTDPTFRAPLRWPPGFPLLLAPFFRSRTQLEGAAVAQAVQVVIGAALPLLVVMLGRRFLPGFLAALGGLLTACCPAMVTTPAFLASET